MLDVLPNLGDEWEETRATLHAYAQAIAAFPRVHLEPHPKWWHASLKVRPDGLTTDAMSLAEGTTFDLRLDLRRHEVVLRRSNGEETSIGMDEGLTGTEMADRLISEVAELGLEGEYERSKFENAEPRSYDPASAESFFDVLTAVAEVFEDHRASLEGEVSPVQLWPHGFDLAFEWLGTRVETFEEEGTITEYPSQLNLGFYPGGEPYFYSNPWPFERDDLLGEQLPHGAVWFTEGWEGSKLEYSTLQGHEDWADRLAEYAQVVYDVAAPTLTA